MSDTDILWWNDFSDDEPEPEDFITTSESDQSDYNENDDEGSTDNNNTQTTESGSDSASESEDSQLERESADQDVRIFGTRWPVVWILNFEIHLWDLPKKDCIRISDFWLSRRTWWQCQ